MPRAITCGSANTSASVLIGPAGTPTASNFSASSALDSFFVNSNSRGISVSRLTTRAALVR